MLRRLFRSTALGVALFTAHLSAALGQPPSPAKAQPKPPSAPAAAEPAPGSRAGETTDTPSTDAASSAAEPDPDPSAPAESPTGPEKKQEAAAPSNSPEGDQQSPTPANTSPDPESGRAERPTPPASNAAEPKRRPIADDERAPLGPDGEPIFEPPLPQAGPVQPAELPPEPSHVAPRTALWLSARSAWLFPLGSLWHDGTARNGVCCYYGRRSWDDFATSGPAVEVALGVRLARNYNLFGLWEYAFLGDGDELGDAFGGQTSASTQFLGIGLRFSTDPDAVGVLVEMAIGYRRFDAEWANGTRFEAVDQFFNTRIGVGADIRINDELSVTPMLTLGGGVFGEANWTFADGSEAGAFSSFLGTPVDEPSQHIPVGLQLGVQYDAFGSD